MFLANVLPDEHEIPCLLEIVKSVTRRLGSAHGRVRFGTSGAFHVLL